MRQPAVWIGVVAVMAAAGIVARASAVDAVAFPMGPASNPAGSALGGCGWSFVPTNDMAITSVGYLELNQDGGNPNTIVSIWLGTNTILASYTGITNTAAQMGDLISAPVTPLSLTRGQLYSITVSTGPLGRSSVLFAVHDNTGMTGYTPFVLAPQLSQYEGWQLTQEGEFVPIVPDPVENQELMFLGPTFTFTTSIVSRPVLNIAPAPNQSVQLTWTTNAAGFALQQSLLVTGTYLSITNSPTVVGANYSTILPGTNATGFFRLARPN